MQIAKFKLQMQNTDSQFATCNLRFAICNLFICHAEPSLMRLIMLGTGPFAVPDAAGARRQPP